MAWLCYHGIDSRFTDTAGLVDSEQFRVILAANPHLSLFEEAGESHPHDLMMSEMTYREISLPLPPKHNANVGIKDTNTNNFMWVLYDDEAEVEDPSPEFIEILKLIDLYSITTRNKRIFEAPIPFKTDSPEILAATFDFTTGNYIL